MLHHQTVLIVEDEPLIAMTIAQAILDAEGEVVGPVATVTEALAILEMQAVAAAVLDAKLADRDVTPVAIVLSRAQVPFVVFTGTGLPAELAAILPHTPVVMKPATMDAVLAVLAEQMKVN
jgi:ActR/RegA family two-component response regulator